MYRNQERESDSREVVVHNTANALNATELYTKQWLFVMRISPQFFFKKEDESLQDLEIMGKRLHP